MSSSGSLGQVTFPQLFGRLLREGFGGRLRVQCGPARKAVFFEQGRPIFASSTNPADGFGEILARKGAITREQLREALGRSPSARKVGKTLVELGYLEAAALMPSLEHQVAEIILSLFPQEDGAYLLEASDLSTDDIVKLRLSPAALVREGVRRMGEPSLLLRALGTFDGGVATNGGPTVPMALIASETRILDRLRGGPQRVRDLCTDAGAPAIEVCRSLIALQTTGYLAFA